MIEKERRESISKEIVSRVLEPIQKELKFIADVRFYGYKIPEFKTWQVLKFERPSLVYMIPNDLREKIDNFSRIYEKYSKHHNRLINIIFSNEIINKYDIGEEFEKDGNCNYNSIEFHFPEVVGQIDLHILYLYSILYLLRKTSMFYL